MTRQYLAGVDIVKLVGFARILNAPRQEDLEGRTRH